MSVGRSIAAASTALACALTPWGFAMGGAMLDAERGAPVPVAPDVRVEVIQHVRGRTGRSLNGRWRVIVDPYGHGHTTPWSGPRRPDDPEAFWAERPAPAPTERVEHWFDDAHTLDVPGDWNSQTPELLYYEGAVWYRRTLEVDDPDDGRRRFLCFGAVANRARVFVNGREIGSHEGGFTPFHLEVTTRLRAGENDLVVLADNTRRPDALPAMMSDWWNYGGITRDVRLVEVPATFIRDYRVGLDAEGARITGWARLDPPAPAAAVRLEIPALRITLEAQTDGRGIARFSCPTPERLARWSPRAPRLYNVRLESPSDAVEDRVGFRTISTRGPEILLNGEPVFLRGICIHEEAPTREGRAWSEDDARTLLGWAKDLGCNFVRLSHYPHNEHMVRVADELGLLVWSEIPVYWLIDFENPATLALAKAMLAETITRDRNRASCVIWSVGNETGHEPARTRFRLELAELVKRADPTRLVSAALFARLDFEHTDGGGTRLVRMHVEDPFAEAAHVLAVNEYAGWYYGAVEDIPGVRLTLSHDKPLLISEFGAGSLQGLRGDPTHVWTEDHAARLYEHQIAWFESGNIENLRGVSPWILRDFRSPRRLLHGVQDGYNRKGLRSERGIGKLPLGVLREYYHRVAPGVE